MSHSDASDIINEDGVNNGIITSFPFTLIHLALYNVISRYLQLLNAHIDYVGITYPTKNILLTMYHIILNVIPNEKHMVTLEYETTT